MGTSKQCPEETRSGLGRRHGRVGLGRQQKASIKVVIASGVRLGGKLPREREAGLLLCAISL